MYHHRIYIRTSEHSWMSHYREWKPPWIASILYSILLTLLMFALYDLSSVPQNSIAMPPTCITKRSKWHWLISHVAVELNTIMSLCSGHVDATAVTLNLVSPLHRKMELEKSLSFTLGSRTTWITARLTHGTAWGRESCHFSLICVQ